MSQIGTKLNVVNCIFANNENWGEIFGAPNSVHFFNKTDFEQYLFNLIFQACEKQFLFRIE